MIKMLLNSLTPVIKQKIKDNGGKMYFSTWELNELLDEYGIMIAITVKDEIGIYLQDEVKND